MTNPLNGVTTYDYDMTTRARTLVKQQEIVGGFDRADYRTERLWATARDGTRVPVSLVRHVDTPVDGSAPLIVYGYGSYGASMDANFSSARLSLLDRGFVYAIAHIRGGGEMGRRWYLDGKELSKRNTFTDFVACARHLAGTGWTAPDRLVAEGGSAGGLLMGAVANLAPDAFRAIVADVAFVDALNTILDPSLPLTVVEWEEWGNPLEDPEVYAYMKAYSPYENVEPKRYPSILAETSLHDTRVLYVEPAKWIAKLRATAAEPQDFLLKTEMSAGHGGVSGRYNAWRDRAFSYAWVLDKLGKKVTMIYPDYAFGYDHRDFFTQAAKKHGGEVIERLAIPPTESSFTKYFARVPKETEVLYHVMVGPGVLTFVKEMGEHFGRKRPQIFGFIDSLEGVNLAAPGLDYLEGTYFWEAFPRYAEANTPAHVQAYGPSAPLELLRTAYMKMLADPAFLEEASRVVDGQEGEEQSDGDQVGPCPHRNPAPVGKAEPVTGQARHAPDRFGERRCVLVVIMLIVSAYFHKSIIL